jgi:ParB/RepB/Spo0J family partition protein
MMRKYENVDIKKLKPYENNARTHSEEQVEKIANSIKEFGFINPVIIDGDYGIIAGHGRVLGAQKLGMKEVPCLFVEDLTDTQKRAYILADNKLALDAGWDDEILKQEIKALDDLDFDISLTGFDLEDFDFNSGV